MAEKALSGIDRGQSAVHRPTTKFWEIPRMNITWPEAPHAVILRQLEMRNRVAVLALEVNDWNPMGSSALYWHVEDDARLSGYWGCYAVAGTNGCVPVASLVPGGV